jgi:hypothetical protein
MVNDMHSAPSVPARCKIIQEGLFARWAAEPLHAFLKRASSCNGDGFAGLFGKPAGKAFSLRVFYA